MAKTKIVPTVKIADGAGSFIIINEEDFDKKIHVLFDEKPPKKPAAEKTEKVTESKPIEKKPASTAKKTEPKPTVTGGDPA